MKIDILHVSKLANLKIEDKELEKLEKQLSSILEYIETLNQAKTQGIDETSQVTGLENVTREDVTSTSLSQDETLSEAKDKKDGYFKTKTILE